MEIEIAELRGMVCGKPHEAVSSASPKLVAADGTRLLRNNGSSRDAAQNGRKIVYAAEAQVLALVVAARMKADALAAENAKLRKELAVAEAERDRMFELHDEYVAAVERRRAAEERTISDYRAKIEWRRFKDKRPRYLH